MYVDIVISNAFNLKKHFYFLFYFLVDYTLSVVAESSGAEGCEYRNIIQANLSNLDTVNYTHIS